MIKDSGDRTQFCTGAVRDMHEGKGRCDLMPLGIVFDLLDRDPVVYLINCFVERSDWLCLDSAIRTFCKKRGWNMETALLETSKHFEDGAKKYGENNWKKGIPVNCYIDSALRHYLKWRRGDTDEAHDRAFVWNLMCCIWEAKRNESA